ncbi:MAG TPA: hypothetical protein ENK10_00185 [Acidobacteria bacterium]|nr:hypothetical protein [Acidobacteriota bacterium]
MPRNGAKPRSRGKEQSPDQWPLSAGSPGRRNTLTCLHTAEVTGSIPVAPTAGRPWRYRCCGSWHRYRIDEVTAFQVADFDPADGHLRIRRGVTHGRGHSVVGPPKTAKSIRNVAFPRTIPTHLATHTARLEQADQDDAIFPAAGGGPIRYTNWVRRFWKPARAAAGPPDHLGAHTLRRSQVGLLIAEGEHPRVIADLLGHTSVCMVPDATASSTTAPTGPPSGSRSGSGRAAWASRRRHRAAPDLRGQVPGGDPSRARTDRVNPTHTASTRSAGMSELSPSTARRTPGAAGAPKRASRWPRAVPVEGPAVGCSRSASKRSTAASAPRWSISR